MCRVFYFGGINQVSTYIGLVKLLFGINFALYQPVRPVFKKYPD